MLANRWRVRAEFARVRSSSREFARVRGERQFAGYTALNSTVQYSTVVYGSEHTVRVSNCMKGVTVKFRVLTNTQDSRFKI